MAELSAEGTRSAPGQRTTDPLRVIYLLSRAPQARSTFTNAEVEAAERKVVLLRAGLTGNGDQQGWLRAPPLTSRALWASFFRVAARHPRTLSRAFWAIAKPALLAPRDLLVGLRAALSACYLSDALAADIVHAQFAGPAGAGAYVLHRLMHLPYTVRAHAYDIYRPYRWVGPVLREAALVMAISDHGAEHIRSRWSVAASTVRVGVSRDSVMPRDDRQIGEQVRLLTVAALEPKKGHDLAIDAVSLLRRAGYRMELDIVGDGPERDRLTRRASHVGGVRLLGHRDPAEVRGMYRDYDVFLLAARVAPGGDQDGIPVVLMEASLAGLPIVSTRVAGIPELVEHGVSGWCVDSHLEAIATGIIEVAADYPRARQLAAVARRRVETDHDLDREVDQLIALWRSVADTSISEDA